MRAARSCFIEEKLHVTFDVRSILEHVSECGAAR